jgi:branched-chain amino acid transport system permease protein
MKQHAPALVLPALALLALAAMPTPTWIALTVAGIALGTMLFLMASGLTLVFGLMDVMNFAHGAFITLGAYVAVSVLGQLPLWIAAHSLGPNLAALAVAVIAAAVCGALAGLVFERLFIRPVQGTHSRDAQGSHLRQILMTTGALIVVGELMLMLWGAEPLNVAKPALLRGSVLFMGAAIETYRLAAIALGLVIWLALHLTLNRTRLGLLVRAGVENREMVEALGFRIGRLFVLVFATGAALAGIGGAMWAVYQEIVTPAIGAEMTVLVFITVIIGGLGSVGGCLVAAILVGLTANYAGFLAPKLALGSNLALLVLILLWRPRGLFPLAKS